MGVWGRMGRYNGAGWGEKGRGRDSVLGGQ